MRFLCFANKKAIDEVRRGVGGFAQGIVVGEMTNTDREGAYETTIGPRPWREIVRERLAPLGVPLVTDYPFGYGLGRATLPFGRRVRLDADAGKLELVP